MVSASGQSRAIKDTVSYLINAADRVLLAYIWKLINKDLVCEEAVGGC